MPDQKGPQMYLNLGDPNGKGVTPPGSSSHSRPSVDGIRRPARISNITEAEIERRRKKEKILNPDIVKIAVEFLGTLTYLRLHPEEIKTPLPEDNIIAAYNIIARSKHYSYLDYYNLPAEAKTFISLCANDMKKEENKSRTFREVAQERYNDVIKIWNEQVDGTKRETWLKAKNDQWYKEQGLDVEEENPIQPVSKEEFDRIRKKAIYRSKARLPKRKSDDSNS
jgi:hypothetical protein